MLGKLGLRRSTYYYLRSHPREDAYADVRPLVREIFSRTPNGMGYRQVRMWICYIFLNSFQRDSPASLNSTGLM